MINEKNFVSANEEDIEPSYVDEVVGNHDKADGAHAGKFNAINKKIDETEAFYEDAKKFVGETADKVDELWLKTFDAQEKVEAAKDEILPKVSSAERAAEDSNMHANRAAAAASHSEAEMLKIKEYSESAKKDADRAEAAVDKIVDDAAKASAAVVVSESVRDEVGTIKEAVSADVLKSESAAEEAVKAKGSVVQAEVNARAYKNEAEAAKLGAEKARDDAERFSKRGPYVGDNGNWFLWDDSVSSYVDSGMPSKEKGDPGYTPVAGVDYYTDEEKEAFVAEIKEESAEDVAFLSEVVRSIPHNLKYDMSFTIGGISSSGAVNLNNQKSIVTNTVEPLVYDFDVIVRSNTELCSFFYRLYNDDGTPKGANNLDADGYLRLSAGTKFRLMFQTKDGSVLESVDNDIFNSLEVTCKHDSVDRALLVDSGMFATETPINGVKEIYVEGVEGKDLVVSLIRKNFYSSNQYITVFSIAYADVPTTHIATYEIKTDAPLSEFDSVVKIEPIYSGVSGYAVVDFNAFPDGTSFQPQVRVNMTKACNFTLNPMIRAYLEGGEERADIVALNKDIEHLVMQASKSRSSRFGDTLVPLEFVHFTDVHAHNKEWKRIVEYVDRYEGHIMFGLHTGDCCGTSVDDGVDLYSLAKPKNRIIYNAVGNHDTYKAYASGESPETATAEEIYNAVFSDVADWEVVFGEGENVTYYYKDFAESGIRLIVLDDQRWSDIQAEWLASVLDGAKENGLAVITASHMLTANLTERLASTFTPVDEMPSAYGGSNLFESSIVAFKSGGGVHICHLCGHNHFDDVGYTADGVLNIQVESASGSPDARLESRRVEGTRSFDCFNVVSVDVNTKRLKIIRIGCNSNAALQDKTLLCYDYENKKIISGVDDVEVTEQSGGGGETWELVASYTHSGNRVIQPTALDMATGYFTCENHGLATGDSIIAFYNIKNQVNCPIPWELLSKANYNDNRVYPIPHEVTVIDDDTFMITSRESYAETNNKNVDVTKFHFETQATDFTGFNNLNIDLNTYDVKIIAHNFGKRVNFKFSNSLVDHHWLAMDSGGEYGLLQGIPITPLGGVESYGSVVLSLQNEVLYGKSEQYMYPIILNSGALIFARTPVGHHYNCPVFYDNRKIDVMTDLYFNRYLDKNIKPKNGGWIQVWKIKK